MSAGVQPMARAAIFAVNCAGLRPVLPVKALALPELTTSARALPRLSLARHHSTGAEGHFELVNTPATAVPAASSASSTSVRSRYLMPAAAVASLHAGDRRHVGYGLRGEGGDGDRRGHGNAFAFVMPGLVQGIHAFLTSIHEG